MRLTPYGIREWLSVTLACGGAAVVLVWLGWLWALLPAALIWLAVAWFFRDPTRRPRADLAPEDLLSPADGRVSAVERVERHEATGGPALVIRIFLSVLNVHVNRAPADGEVLALAYAPGRFLDARTEASARENESNLITMRLETGETIGVRQVAGKVARRIVCPLTVGRRLARGERFGMIKFGSTTELILPRPDDAAARVTIGQKVRGGRTVLATLPVPAGAPRATREPAAASAG